MIQFCLGSQKLQQEPSTFRRLTEDVDYTHTVHVELEEQEVADETVLLMRYSPSYFRFFVENFAEY